MTRPRVLTFDLNKITGWAADPPGPCSINTIPVVGQFIIDKGGDPSGACGNELWRRAALLIEKLAPDIVSYEAPLPVEAVHRIMSKPGGPKTMTAVVRKTYGYAFAMDMLCTSAGIPCFEVNVQDARHHFVQNRYATKEAVNVRCRAMRWPVLPGQLDISDALCAFDYSHAQLRARRLEDLVREARSA